MYSIKILRYPTDDDWARCKMLALNTIGKQYAGAGITEEWKKKILRAEHSPIRTLMFTVRMEIPYYVSVHFCRHKYGVEHFVQSQRNDRQKNYDRDAARQDAAIVHIMDINAQELIHMSHKRLCYQADQKTRIVMKMICSEVTKMCPEFDGMFMPTCEYIGACPEFHPCEKNRME